MIAIPSFYGFAPSEALVHKQLDYCGFFNILLCALLSRVSNSPGKELTFLPLPLPPVAISSHCSDPRGLGREPWSRARIFMARASSSILLRVFQTVTLWFQQNSDLMVFLPLQALARVIYKYTMQFMNILLYSVFFFSSICLFLNRIQNRPNPDKVLFRALLQYLLILIHVCCDFFLFQVLSFPTWIGKCCCCKRSCNL